MATLDKLRDSSGNAILTPQHVCVYGAPKSGKTQLIGSLAKEGFKLIWFDLEKGVSTLLKPGLLTDEELSRITYLPIVDTKEAPIAHATIDRIVRGGKFSICEEHGRIDCPLCKRDGSSFTDIDIPIKGFDPNTIVVVDSFTQLSISVTNTILKDKSIDYQETLHDFRNQGNYLNRMFGYIQQAPFHIVGTAHETEAEREDGTTRIVPSIGSRNYAITCAKFFSDVVYMDKVNKEHKAFSLTNYSNKVLTGSRLEVNVGSSGSPSLAGVFKGMGNQKLGVVVPTPIKSGGLVINKSK